VTGVGAATRATYVAFASTGFAFASWAARIPQVKERLDLNPSELGLLLLAIAAGAVIALPLSGPIVGRFGSRRAVACMAVLGGVGLVMVAIGYGVGVAPVAAGLFVFGAATAMWDVAMNVQGALVERRLGRAIMSRFHAGFSLGTVAGALAGAAMVALDVGVAPHLLVVGVAIAAGVPFEVQRFLPDRDDRAATSTAARDSLTAWRERRTLLIGVFVFAYAFAEGAAADWIGVAVIDGHGADPAIGTLALAAFLAAMTAGRWIGPWLLDAYGRVQVIRGLTLVAVAGLVLFCFGPSTPVAFAGALLWGAGVSLGFPVGMSAGADEPAVAAPRVSVISSIGYCAFLAGPPLIGFLGQRYTVLDALTAVLALLALSGLIAGALRPVPRASPTERRQR
jgi:predicted MFS family arabinose efflux permease